MELSLQALDPFFNKLGKLQKTYLIAICAGIIVLLIAPFVYFFYVPQFQEIAKLEEEIEKLDKELKDAQRKLKRLPKLKKELAVITEELNKMKKSLPESEEIPNLLTSISHSGQDSGLEFLLFQPKREKEIGFFAEIPVSMNVTGNYHNVVSFFDKVSRLNRIVNIKDIRLKATGGEDKKLNVFCIGVTYKFIATD